MGMLSFRPSLSHDPFIVHNEMGKPEWTKQTLHCSKLARTEGIMICERDASTIGTSAKMAGNTPMVSYTFRVTIDRPKHQLPQAERVAELEGQKDKEKEKEKEQAGS